MRQKLRLVKRPFRTRSKQCVTSFRSFLFHDDFCIPDYKESSPYANFITAIFLNIPKVFGLYIFWIYSFIFVQKIAVMKEILIRMLLERNYNSLWVHMTSMIAGEQFPLFDRENLHQRGHGLLYLKNASTQISMFFHFK